MALTVADTDAGPPSPVVGARVPKGDVVKTITFDSSYATGGEALTPAMLGLATIDILIASPSAGWVFAYDGPNSKLQAFASGSANGALAEAASTTDLSAVATRVWARGNRI